MRAAVLLVATLATLAAAQIETRTQCRIRLDKRIAAVDEQLRKPHGNADNLNARRRRLTDERYECRKLPGP
jgi:hypothetical protein